MSLCIFFLIISTTFGKLVKISQVHISLADEDTSMHIHWAINSLYGSISLKYAEKNLLSQPAAITILNAKCKAFLSVEDNYYSKKQITCNIKLKNLAFNTFYEYKIGTDELGWSKTYEFRSKRVEKLAKFIVYGDFGVGPQTTETIDSIRSVMNNENFDGIIHAGDIAYDLDTDEGNVGDSFLNSIEEIASKFPYMVSQGNHENKKVERHYKSRFTMPGDSSGLWYSFNYGKAHFVAYTQEMFFTGNYEKDNGRLERMMEFLWNDLASVNRTEYPWIIVYTHRPFYCSLNLLNPEIPYYVEDPVQNYTVHENHVEDCTSNSMLLRSKFEKLWFDFKVDLVITAHVHLYERTYPVYNGEFRGCEGITENYCKGAKAPIYIIAGVPGNQESYAFGNDYLSNFTVFQSSHISFGKLMIQDENYLRWEQVKSCDTEIVDFLDLFK